MHRRTPAVAGVVALILLLAAPWALAADASGRAEHTRHRAVARPVPTPTTPPKPGQAAAVPQRVTGPFGTQRTTGRKQVALTFDDGPDPVWTPKLLDQLRTAKVSATFCVIGTQVRRHPALVARIVREGHTLCNHSWRHEFNLGKLPAATIRADLVRTNREIQRAVPGAKIRYFRQPGGKWTARVVAVARELGMIPLGWDVDPRDWAKPGAKAIRTRVVQQARPGSIVLLHDGGGNRKGTLAACPTVIAALRQKYGITQLR
ncbi:Polysaccharide deacetylase [Micromonospora pattaloongensis]|uniref:Polysaccharide deacetylase n=1 Tax=Micromonospora pattaloongensis TaxID=405436 RepID=A0A1H3IBA9_9ACTN|nr:polysaccharide deacetylase family protein [Micromonospora pattaloongensis]SDY24802.1 Polysaccharide deacetylase [Micromonospora pattaloongensis]